MCIDTESGELVSMNNYHFNPLFPLGDNFLDSCHFSAWLRITVRRNGIVINNDTGLVATGQKYTNNENCAEM